MKSLRSLCLVLVAATLSFAATAQTPPAPEKVLKAKDVSTDDLIDALAIPPTEATGLSRGFRPVAPGQAKAKPYGPGKANLLVTFLTNSSQLSPEAEGLLDKMAAAMQSDTLAGVAFKVHGHADARGDESANFLLSKARAEAVVKYLVGKHGILEMRLHSEGKGSAEPLNKQRVDAPENRRVTFISTREAAQGN
ncbi:OmpA family protein [Inhella gelatinilytica]|uniref:OmpA family protein n=1 Tax=Inhella gelatinilytica TaxID=2795030 RepID=A0A931IZV7_9BURK|nr:OmpA family protein [Inhella gelatinilytica]MBH9554070.1 OmpA family protein [Inhella gelatinilytica]